MISRKNVEITFHAKIPDITSSSLKRKYLENTQYDHPKKTSADRNPEFHGYKRTKYKLFLS